MSSRLPYERTDMPDQTLVESPGKGSVGNPARVNASAAEGEVSGTASAARAEGKRVVGTAAEGAKEVAQEASTQARHVVQEAGTQLRVLANEGRDQLRAQADQQTRRASQNLRTLAEQARALAEGRIDDAGALGDRVGTVAAQLSTAADRLERRGFDGLLADVTAFARRRPAAFIGLTTLAGFAVSRIGRNLTGSRDGDGSADREPVSALPEHVTAGSVGTFGPGYRFPSESPDEPATEPIVPGMSADVVVDEDVVFIQEHAEPEFGRP